MLPPRDTPTRERKRLDGLWRFRLDPGGVGRAEGWWRGLLPDAREMPVPASYNDIIPDASVRDHVGEAWYQTVARVPAGWAGQRIVLRFDAAAHRATAWCDDREVAEHEGGFTPFEADLTGHVTPGEQIRITAVVDNRLTWQSMPPGYVEDTPDGARQRSFHDFFNYAGLHRSVWLYRTPIRHIADVTVVTGVEGSIGTVEYRVDAAGAADLETQVILSDASGAEVTEARGASGRLSVPGAHLWRPGEGYLYQLATELRDGGSAVDSYTLPVGIRGVAVEGHRFLINGEPFYFTGFGRHEDSAVRGKGHDDALMVHDYELMRWIGANSFRSSHYPYAEEQLEYADRHGIVVIDEVAAVGLNVGIVPGLLGSAPAATFSPETINEATRATHAQALRELVARDKNHPSVVLWSIANEPESTTPEARAYFAPLAAETRRLDPTRPIGFANVMLAPPDRDVISDLFDVLMLNRYYGWYVDPGDLAAAERHLADELEAWVARYDKPIIFTEYGADAVAGLHRLPATPWTEEYQAQVLETFHRVFDRFEAVVGEHVWHFADFATAAGTHRVDGNRKGVFTRDRRPKASAEVLRRRWCADSDGRR